MNTKQELLNIANELLTIQDINQEQYEAFLAILDTRDIVSAKTKLGSFLN